MENIDQMRKRHNKEIKELRENCKHEASEWYPYSDARGCRGSTVRICTFCEKVLETRSRILPENITISGGVK